MTPLIIATWNANGVSRHKALPELSSDHCPVIFHLLHQLQHIERPCRLTSNRTNWARYKKYVGSHTGFSSPLNTEQDIDQLAGDIEPILVAAPKASTPQDKYAAQSLTRQVEILNCLCLKNNDIEGSGSSTDHLAQRVN